MPTACDERSETVWGRKLGEQPVAMVIATATRIEQAMLV
jgi:hypothetical protein